MNDKTIKVSVEIFILNEKKELLLGKRKNCFGEGDWGLPGGHTEWGEFLIDSAIRELEEETGLVVEKDALERVLLYEDITQDKHYLKNGFLLKSWTGEIRLMEPDKCFEWKFFPVDKLPENIFVAHVEEIRMFLRDENNIKN